MRWLMNADSEINYRLKNKKGAGSILGNTTLKNWKGAQPGRFCHKTVNSSTETCQGENMAPTSGLVAK